ncbi:MAG: hypothetical protein KF809_11960 [Chloroflexi bacterium]|nr:hypothetical protein [Chloroflexota bacterium]
MRTRLLAVLAGVLLATPLALVAGDPPAARAAPGNGGRPWVMVDRDGRAAPGDCDARTRTHRRIQDALDAARDGERIAVCPGRYPEALRVDGHARDVYLAAEESFQAVLTPPGTERAPAVDIERVAGFEIRGFRLRVSGRVGPVIIGPITIPGTRVCTPASVAIRIRDATDAIVRGMRIEEGTGCGYRVGIQVERSRARVSANVVANFLSQGITVRDGSDVDLEATDIRFLHADLVEHLPGAALDRAATGLVIDHARAARIRTITVFSKVPARDEELPPQLWEGIVISDVSGPVLIRGDTVVRRVGLTGIRIERSHQVTIRNTLVERAFGDAYRLDDLSGARIIGSDAERSTTGFRLGAGTSGVVMRQVRGIRNVVADCVDLSRGTRTAGTANTWRRSEGRTSVPGGLCAPAAD